MMHPEQKPYKTARDTLKFYGIAGNITLKLHGMHLKPDTYPYIKSMTVIKQSMIT